MPDAPIDRDRSVPQHPAPSTQPRNAARGRRPGRLRRLTGESRVGHAGTLDPAATGVLPVCVGQATRLVEYLSDADKMYLTEVVLGVQTETDDLDGTVIRTAAVPELSAAELVRLLAGFRGILQQVPPAYAAIKVGGKKLYDLARAGQAIAATPRTVTIYRLDLLAWTPPAMTLLVECSKGTYIRSLARDIGMAAGCGGYVQSLCRVRTGPFCLDDAWPLEELAERCTPETWPHLALHPETFLLHWPALGLSASDTRAWRHGMAVAGPTMADRTLARVYGADGAFVGVGRFDATARCWRPEKVLSLEDSGGL
jgi:tRNA pseudouridine55 synthase